MGDGLQVWGVVEGKRFEQGELVQPVKDDAGLGECCGGLALGVGVGWRARVESGAGRG